jgi:hypothetical protein
MKVLRERRFSECAHEVEGKRFSETCEGEGLKEEEERRH